MTAGLFATLAITHVGPLTENPVTANAASVPNARGQVLDETGAELLVHAGQAAFEVRLGSGDLRGELLEQLQGLAGRNVAGERAIRR